MTTNEGSLDRALRASLGILLIAVAVWSGIALFANVVLYWCAIVIGVVLIATAVTGFCPAYRLLGVRTCER
jgi:uncharacterized membrane protein YdbT with pleckstrin-like domain